MGQTENYLTFCDLWQTLVLWTSRYRKLVFKDIQYLQRALFLLQALPWSMIDKTELPENRARTTKIISPLLGSKTFIVFPQWDFRTAAKEQLVSLPFFLFIMPLLYCIYNAVCGWGNLVFSVCGEPEHKESWWDPMESTVQVQKILDFE